MNNIRKITTVAIVAAVFTFGIVFSAPALAGNTFWDDTTTGWISGTSAGVPVAMSGEPCDPAQVKRDRLFFLP